MIVARHAAARGSRAATRAAFTLLEVLVVVAILVILVSVLSVGLFKYLDEAREDAARIGIAKIEFAVNAYKIKHGQFPQSLQELTGASEVGHSASLEVTDLNDPWGQQYQYQPQVTSPTGKPKIMTTSPSSGKVIQNWE